MLKLAYLQGCKWSRRSCNQTKFRSISSSSQHSLLYPL